MKRKVIITKINQKIITAIEENGQIVELHCSPVEDKERYYLGNIYVGKVKNIVPNIGAAFIEIAKGVECYYDIAQNSNPIFTNKIGKKALCIGDELIVQIQKEAVKTKALTLTANINLNGKYVVLTHGDTRIGISSKIEKEKRKEWKEALSGLQGESYGYIVRTNAQNISLKMISDEMRRLETEYKELLQVADKRVCYSCLKSAPKPYIADLRNIRQDGFSDICIEEEDIYKEVLDFLATEQPEDIDKLVYYKDTSLPLHKLHGVETAIEQALKERVWLKSGAYLIIQPTEAMTVIDVNTGKSTQKKKQDAFYYKINEEAAFETARQLRLRNLSGIVIVDFINLEDNDYMNQLLDVFGRVLAKDPISTTLIDVTKLQLIEVTRKKVRRPFHESYRL